MRTDSPRPHQRSNRPGDAICLITGGTSGIGRASAFAMAARGERVVVVSRDAVKGLDAVRHMRRRTGNEEVHFLQADLSSQNEVRRLVATFCERFGRLDVLVNNAGAIFGRRRESADGVEMTFALNHMAYFSLTCLLLDLLLASAPSRVINVTCDAHRRAVLDVEDLQSTKDYAPLEAYARSKLANVLFTYELAHRLEGTGVTVNAAHPGFIRSEFGRNVGGLLGLGLRAAYLFGASPERGADTVVRLATSPELEGVTGEYFAGREAVPSSEVSYDRETAWRLWERSEEIAELDGHTCVGSAPRQYERRAATP